MKSMTEPTKWPIASTIGPIVNVASCHAPPGIKNVIIGINISDTRADTSLPAAPPIMNATANPTTPYFERKTLNSSTKPFGRYWWSRSRN